MDDTKDKMMERNVMRPTPASGDRFPRWDFWKVADDPDLPPQLQAAVAMLDAAFNAQTDLDREGDYETNVEGVGGRIWFTNRRDRSGEFICYYIDSEFFDYESYRRSNPQDRVTDGSGSKH